MGMAIIWIMAGDRFAQRFPSRKDLGTGLNFSSQVSSDHLKPMPTNWCSCA